MQDKEGRTEIEKQREGKAIGVTESNWRETMTHALEGAHPLVATAMLLVWWSLGGRWEYRSVDCLGADSCWVLLQVDV